MRIYRAEHRKSRKGPGGSIGWHSLPKSSHLYFLPTPDEEGIALPSSWYGDRCPWVCGTTSKVKLRTWFPKVNREVLFEKDIVFRVYEVDPSKVRKGHHQVIFKRAGARIVETLDPRTFLPIAA